MDKVFVDSNVLIHWVILSNLIKNSGEAALKRKQVLASPIYYSYKLIEEILKNNFAAKYKFCTSHLVLTELFNILFEHLISEKMIDEYVPLTDWYKERDKPFPKGTFTKIVENNKENLNKLLSSFNFEEGSMGAVDIAGVLISENGCRTHDAFILGSAIDNDCKIFVTNDTTLKKQVFDLKQIEIILPKDFK